MLKDEFNAPDQATAEYETQFQHLAKVHSHEDVESVATPEPERQVGPLQLRCMAMDYIESCQNHVGETSFFYECGLTDETIRHFRLGYDPEKHCVVIPVSGSYYVTQNVDVGDDQKGMNKQQKPKGLRQPLFNVGSLSDHPEQAVFIAESLLDAISIVQCGGNAIALGGCSIVTLRKVLDSYRPQCQFILAFNHDEPGQQVQEIVQSMIEDRGLSCSTPLHPAFMQYKDANAILKNDPDTLVDAIEQERQHLIFKLDKEAQ